METLWIILVLLLATRLCGALMSQFKQPVLVGEVFAGIAVGYIVGLYDIDTQAFELSTSHHFMTLSDLGIFFLMLLGGVEMRPRELVESRYTSIIVATSAMIVPFAGGFTITWFWLPESDMRFAQSLFVGTALSITAVPVIIKILMDMQLLTSKIGRLIVSAALFDDILSLILLSILTAFINTGGFPDLIELLIIISQIFLFLVIVLFLGNVIMPPLARFIAGLNVEEMEFSFLLLVGVVFAIIAELMGLHFILGAFAAGLFFGRHTINESVYYDLRKKLNAITMGFLAPIFFASIGFELNLSAVATVPLFLSMLICIAFLGKLVGAALPAMMLGTPSRDAWTIGMAMSARGAIELIIAGIALRAGLFESRESANPILENLFSSIVIVAIVTTFATPIALRYILSERENLGG